MITEELNEIIKKRCKSIAMALKAEIKRQREQAAKANEVQNGQATNN